MAEEEEVQKVSKYNSGVAIIMRLDGLWKDCNNHSRLGKFYLWNLDLDRIWCELARDILDKEYKEYKERFDEFDTNLAKEGDFKDGDGDGFDKINKAETDKRGKHYKILMEKELFLRRLENHVGKGTAWDDGEGDDFD